jgi:hypothetical protein
MSTTFHRKQEVWDALEGCQTVDQIYDVLEQVPAEFGIWFGDVVGENNLEVTNQQWDGEQFITESQVFEVQLCEEEFEDV